MLLLGWPTRLDNQPSDNLRTNEDNEIEERVLSKRQMHHLGQSLQYDGDGHLLTIAPTGSGKGIGVIIPNLLHYAWPTIVIDPKGENLLVTARYRKVELGHRILLLDPFKAVKDEYLDKYGLKRGRLNPMDLFGLSQATTFDLDAQVIASLLAGDDASLEDPFWDKSAKRVLAGLLLDELNESKKEIRSPKLRNVIDIIFGDDPISQIRAICQKKDLSLFIKASLNGGLIAHADSPGMREGIIATAQSYLSIFQSPELLESLEESTINLADIKNKDDYTLYIIIPPTKLHSHSSLLQTWVGVLMHAVMERDSRPEFSTLFMLDECANLGRMQVLRKAVTLLRGYGLQVWMFFQDLSQMESLFGTESNTIINNCGVLQTFGIGRMSAARPIAHIVGHYPAKTLLELDPSQQMLSLSTGKAFIVRKLCFFRDQAFIGRDEPNPMIPDRLRI